MADEPVPEPVATEPAPEELTVVAGRRSLSRQRPLAAIVILSAVLVLVGLTAGPWARTTVPSGSEDTADLHIELDPSGGVHLDDGDAGNLADRYGASANEQQRAILAESIHGTSADLARVLAVLFAVVAAVALLRDLTRSSWVLVAAMALACLVTVTLLRDDVISALATSTTTMDLGATPRTAPTGWGSLALGAAAAAALAAAFAAAPRPVAAPVVVERPVEAPRRRFGWKARAPRNTF